MRNPSTFSRARLIASMLLLGVSVVGCTTTDGPAQGGLADLGSSLGNSLGQNTDTNGTNRRPDVYGGCARPAVPSIESRYPARPARAGPERGLAVRSSMSGVL